MPWGKLANKHAGETGVIIGNGPSLRAVPYAFLNKYPSFGVNKIYLMSKFVPTYYVCSDDKMETHIGEILNIRSQVIFVPYTFRINGNNILKYKHRNVGRSFCFNPPQGIYTGWTVTFTCLQLAYWMGFTTILLVGVDHYYKYPEGTFPDEDLPKTIIKKLNSDGDDHNHFTTDYYEPGEEFMAGSDLRLMEDSYRQAEEAYRKDGRRIINLTYDTKLDIFEKGKLWHWLP